MKLPDEIKLPFFAYGIFKPGQLCFHRINELVDKYCFCNINGILKERDGIPLLIKSKHSIVKGTLIYFYDGKENEGYNRINEIEPDEVYYWDVVHIENEIIANALIGKRVERGSFDIEDLDNWDGMNDPLFKQGIEEIELILRENLYFDWKYKSLFRLQMGYTLLWTAIERYAGLKYHLGGKPTKKVYKIADEPIFAKSLGKYVSNGRDIYSATDLEKCTLDPKNPRKSIEYYYQVRSNAIHRGKVVTRDFDILKSSLTELLAIFKDILNDSFRIIDASKHSNLSR